MPLKNYTSTVPAARSITYIESCLTRSGARQIMKSYDNDGRTEAISFSIPLNGNDIFFKLPAKVEACTQVLLNDLSPRAKPDTRKKIPEQAERTAWKICSDWIEAQMAMVELAQVDVLEVFLPYMYDPKSDKTFYESAKAKGVAGFLPAPKG